MRFLYILHSFPKSSESFILNEIESLTNEGISIDVITFFYRNEFGNELFRSNAKIKVHQIPRLNRSRIIKYGYGIYLIFRHFHYIRKLIHGFNFTRFGIQARNLTTLYVGTTALQIKNREQIRTIHCHFGDMLQYARMLNEMDILRCKTVVTFHGRDINKPLINEDFEHYKRELRFVDQVIVNSDFSKQRLQKLGFKKEIIQVLPMPVDFKKFNTDSKIYSDEGKLVLIAVGRLEKEKGFDILIKSVNVLINELKLKNICLQIVGDGSQMNILKSMVEGYALNEAVHFLGFVQHDSLPEQMKKSDLLILPSVKTIDSIETQGLVLQEAQAIGIPVIASNIGGIPEGIIDKKTGFLFKENDHQDLVNCIKFFADNPDALKTMGQNASEFVEVKYDIDNRLKKLMEILI